jgi:LysM repeat protein
MKSKNLLSLVFILTAFLIVSPSHLWAQDSPPTSQNRQSGMEDLEVVETESGIYYTVKKGDTLWGISQRFSNSAYLWPDLWSGNSQIANPHRIYPGERIRLYRRQDVEQHTQPVEEETPVEATVPVEETPEPEPEPEPIVQIEPEDTLEPVSGYFIYAAMDQVGFIRKKALKPDGKIFRVRNPRKMISENDIVYINYEKASSLGPGSRYTVYRTFDPLKDRTTGKYIGIQHYLLGVVEIIQSEPDYAIGKIVRSFSNIRVGDLLMPYTRKSVKIARQKSQEGLFGKVIIAENHNLIIGDHTRAFINKGEKDGVIPGQIYNIYYQDTERVATRRKKTRLKPVVIGSLLVLHTEKTTATVDITNVTRNISPGSLISTPFE